MIHKPDAILITMPVRFFQEYPGGLESFLKMMEHVNEERTVWNNTIAAIPTQQVEFVYFVYGGKVQLRLTILEYERNSDKYFSDGGKVREFKQKNWVRLVGPVITAPHDIPMRGFQGFRYTELLF